MKLVGTSKISEILTNLDNFLKNNKRINILFLKNNTLKNLLENKLYIENSLKNNVNPSNKSKTILGKLFNSLDAVFSNPKDMLMKNYDYFTELYAVKQPTYESPYKESQFMKYVNGPAVDSTIVGIMKKTTRSQIFNGPTNFFKVLKDLKVNFATNGKTWSDLYNPQVMKEIRYNMLFTYLDTGAYKSFIEDAINNNKNPFNRIMYYLEPEYKKGIT